MCRMFPVFVLLLCVAPAYAADRPDPHHHTPHHIASCAQIALAGIVGGSRDLVVFDQRAGALVNLTHSAEDEQAPAWSPDGRRIAFEAHYHNNWDVYILDIIDKQVHRLTDHPAYDGQPAWSPDSAHIAYESNRDGNLEIYTTALGSDQGTRITTDQAADIEPVWMADGTGLVFGSWRSGKQQLYQLDLETQIAMPLSAEGDQARQPALSPDGQWLAYISTHETGVQLNVRNMSSGAITAVSSSNQHHEWPVWLYGPSPEQMSLLTLKLVGTTANQYPQGWSLHMQSDIEDPDSSAGVSQFPVGQWEDPTCAPAQAPSVLRPDLERLSALPQPVSHLSDSALVVVPMVHARQPRLAADVVASFEQLQEHTLRASGHPFLDTLNDVWRDLDHPSGSYLSWHKTGRAFDVRDWYAPRGRQTLFISRQILGEQTYFRIYLRAAQQDGSQGQSLRESWWQTDGRLSRAEWAAAGGRALPPPDGYYVDFTDLAERYGWTRIPALTAPDGDWRRTFLDLEYWHYEQRDGLKWYAAMQHIYSDAQLEARYSWARLMSQGYTAAQLREAGIPQIALPDCARSNPGRPHRC